MTPRSRLRLNKQYALRTQSHLIVQCSGIVNMNVKPEVMWPQLSPLGWILVQPKNRVHSRSTKSKQIKCFIAFHAEKMLFHISCYERLDSHTQTHLIEADLWTSHMMPDLSLNPICNLNISSITAHTILLLYLVTQAKSIFTSKHILSPHTCTYRRITFDTHKFRIDTLDQMEQKDSMLRGCEECTLSCNTVTP